MQAKNLVFIKSSYSNGQAECVEVAVDTNGDRYIRDSKDKTGPVLGFTGARWGAFVAGVKAGEFDVR